MEESLKMNDAPICTWCGVQHQTKCPLVKAIEYRRDGTIKQVTFFSHQELTATQPPTYYIPTFSYGPPQ